MKNILKALSVSLFCSLTSNAALATATEVSQAKNHELKYGLNFVQQKQGGYLKDTNYTGIFLGYTYKEVSNVFIDANFASSIGRAEISDNPVLKGHMRSYLTEFSFTAGYTFAISPTLTLSPFAGLGSFSELNNAKVTTVGSDSYTYDLDIVVNNYQVGCQAEFKIDSRFAIAPRAKIVKSSRGELKTSEGKNSNSSDIKPSTFLDIELPIKIYFSDRLGMIASVSSATREMKIENSETKDFGTQRVQIGLLHSF